MRKLIKIILSKSRWDTITTHMLLKDYYLVVPENEYENYKKSLNINNIIKIPDNITGLGAIRNWVLDYFEEDVVMLDDDIKALYNLMNEKGLKITDPDYVEFILWQTYSNAKDLGITCWGYSQVSNDVRKYRPSQPFSLTGWIGTIVGVNGRKVRFTEVNKIKVDADFCLECMIVDRIIWIDNRYSFVCTRDTNKGGNSFLRSQKRVKLEKEFLKKKWGNAVEFRTKKQREGLIVKVNRTDPDLSYLY